LIVYMRYVDRKLSEELNKSSGLKLPKRKLLKKIMSSRSYDWPYFSNL